MMRRLPIRAALRYQAARSHIRRYGWRVHPSGYWRVYWRGRFLTADSLSGLAWWLVEVRS